LAGSGVSVAERIDPFYDGLWVQGSQGAWARAGESHRQSGAGLGRLPAILQMDADEAWDTVTSSYRWGLKLAVLSTVDAYRTASVQQVQAITGAGMIAGRSPATLSALFATGLLDLGRPASALVPTEAGRVGYLLRPSRTKVFERRLAPLLTYPELVSITGGRGWMSGGFYDRHNVLSTELSLRVAELCEVGTVMGEKFASHDLLFGTGVGRAEVESFSRGDGVIVRADGLRIVFEMTASLNASNVETQAKFDKWAALFDRDPFDANGTVVVFVVANQPDKPHASKVSVPMLRARIADAIRRHPGSGRVRSRDRFFIVDYSDWFPQAGTVSDGFFTMRAQTVPMRPGDAPRIVDLLNQFELDMGQARFDASAIIRNAAGLRSTPTWLRDGQAPPQVLDAMLTAHGLADIPVAPRWDGKGPGRMLNDGSSGGVSTPARPVVSLRTVTDNGDAQTPTSSTLLSLSQWRSQVSSDGPDDCRHRGSGEGATAPEEAPVLVGADDADEFTDEW
jgi:hypothetical protein